MGRKGNGIPLRDRLRPDREPDVTGDDPCPARHCQVLVDGVLRPGLLVEWRRTSAGWEGRVIYARRMPHGGWGQVEEWLSQGSLTPC